MNSSRQNKPGIFFPAMIQTSEDDMPVTSLPVANSTTSDPNKASLENECKWGTLNTALVMTLCGTLMLNMFAAIILFRVPVVTVRGRSNPVYLCLRFLNITDIAQSSLLLIMPLLADNDCNWAGGTMCCNIMGFFALSLLLVSPLFTILMAFDRVIALYKPFKYRNHLGLKMLKICLPVTIIIVLVVSGLPLGGIGEYHVVRGRRMCLLDTITNKPENQKYVVVVHAIFLTALVFMSACTVTFQLKLCQMSFERKHPSTTRRRPAGRRSRNATITTMSVCFIFIVCYLPYVSRVLHESTTNTRSHVMLTYATFGLAFLQPLLNPIVYISTNVRYKKELLRVVSRICRRFQSSDYDSSSESATATSRSTVSEWARRHFNHHRGNRNGCNPKTKNPHPTQTSSVPPTRTQSCQSTSRTPSVYSTRGRARSGSEAPEGTPKMTHSLLVSTLDRKCPGASSVRRQPSSCSGVRSFDSQEHIAAAVKRATFGRLGRTSTGDPNHLSVQPTRRVRSATVSGETTPALKSREIARRLSESQSPSVPLLPTQDDGTPVVTKTNHCETSFSLSSSGFVSNGTNPRVSDEYPKQTCQRTSFPGANGRVPTAIGPYYPGRLKVDVYLTCVLDDDVFSKPKQRDSGVSEGEIVLTPNA